MTATERMSRCAPPELDPESERRVREALGLAKASGGK